MSEFNVNEVSRYIRQQGEHHRGRNYVEEFQALLRKHGIAFSPEHVLN